MTSSTTLWMGDLEPYMDRDFVLAAFHQMGENVVTVKHINNKQTSLPEAYCFVEFVDHDHAHNAMLRLNGKVVPNSNPPKRFKLNHASFGKGHLRMPEFSLFVGDLSEDVDDLSLYTEFAKRYPSCRAAKVVIDSDGQKRGYGFVRFTDERDQHKALREMQHCKIGHKSIRVSLAAPKRPPGMGGGAQPYVPYSQPYYPSHQANYNNYYWSPYNQSNSQYYPYPQGYPGYGQDASQMNYDQTYDADGDVLEDPCEEIDVDKLNKEYMEQSEELYTALEESRWWSVDNIMATTVS